MSAKHLALYTFGVFRVPADTPVNDGFRDRNDDVFAEVERCAGFVARSGYADEPGPDSWGLQVYPRFYVERGDGWSPSTLSLWETAEAAMAFSYGGRHAEAMRRARDWFDKPAFPPYALWWVEDGRVPTWSQAVERHEHLHDRGPSAFAFDFRAMHDPQGRPAAIDRDLVRRLKHMNDRHTEARPFAGDRDE